MTEAFCRRPPAGLFRSHMPAAVDAAQAAAARGETPVGAVVVDPASGAVISAAGNRVRETCDPTAHAEILAIRAACAQLGRDRLAGLDLWVTLEPCPMCAAAISQARLRRLYYGAPNPKGGGVDHGPRLYRFSALNHAPEVYPDISAAESSRLLTIFFETLRK